MLFPSVFFPVVVFAWLCPSGYYRHIPSKFSAIGIRTCPISRCVEIVNCKDKLALWKVILKQVTFQSLVTHGAPRGQLLCSRKLTMLEVNIHQSVRQEIILKSEFYRKKMVSFCFSYFGSMNFLTICWLKNQ